MNSTGIDARQGDVTERPELRPVAQWHREVCELVAAGHRFAGLYGCETGTGCRVTALVAMPGSIAAVHTLVEPDPVGIRGYPALSPVIPAALWYERALHDLSGVVPQGHPRLDPLLLAPIDGLTPPRPGGKESAVLRPAVEHLEAADVSGRGVFTMPFGPVRSGVTESIEFLIETPGEDIPHLRVRPHHKHRGVAKAFEGQDVETGVLVAERVEGIAAVAHALAYCHAVEGLAGVVVPPAAARIRVVHAELERIANHLEVVARLTDAAGLSVATARFGWHKERVQRLVSAACGHRFGRGVVVPGGVAAAPRLPGAELLAGLRQVVTAVARDARALLNTASFLDRVRGTGLLDPDLARRYGVLGPLGRGSGFDDDDRWARGYDAYPLLSPARSTRDSGDAAARLRVRLDEIEDSLQLVAEVVGLGGWGGGLRVPLRPRDGFALGWAEAPQGEVLYALDLRAGRVARCLARSASLHDMLMMHHVFHTEVLTDFAFIEASFGLSAAGVAM